MEREFTSRHPVVSGLFYPDNREELERSIESYLADIDRETLYATIREQINKQEIIDSPPTALICPHAGYIFSGRVQAYSYALLDNAEVDTAIIIGPAHQKAFKGISVNLDHAYETPLGAVKVDLEFAEMLISHSKYIFCNEEAHLQEHAVEIQIPFLQKVLPKAVMVPILFGEQNWEMSKLLRDALISAMEKLQKRYLVIVSSDLSHYHTHVDAAELDGRLIKDIKAMNPQSFYEGIQSGKSEACGFSALLTGIMLSKKLGKGKAAILYHTDSGEISGDRKRVVGYLSAALY